MALSPAGFLTPSTLCAVTRQPAAHQFAHGATTPQPAESIRGGAA